MKKLLFSLALLIVATSIGLAASGQVVLNGTVGGGVQKAVKAYANSQVDTVIYRRDPSVTSFSFAIHAKDSVSITSVKYIRVVDGTQMTAIAADTLSSFASWASTTDGSTIAVMQNGRSMSQSVTATPFPDVYLFIVTYAGSANGVTTPTAVYEVLEQYTRR